MLALKNVFAKESGRDAGESGITTMVLFIAGIIVATLAFGVIVQTSSNLAGRGGRIGDDAGTAASSRFHIDSITIADVDDDQDIDDLYITVKLAPGSDPLNLESTLITLSSQDHFAQLEYVSDLGSEDATHFNCEEASPNDGGSGRTGLIADPEKRFTASDPVISQGCIVQLHIDMELSLGASALPGERFDLRISTDKTLAAFVQFSIPQAILGSLEVIK